MKRSLLCTVAVLLTGMTVAGCGLLPKEVEETPPPLIAPIKSAKEVYPVKRDAVAERVQIRAMMAPRREAAEMFKIGGRIKQRHVEAGDTVTQGQLLVELETGNLQTQVELARIQLKRARLRLEQARAKSAAAKGGMDSFEEQFLLLDEQAAAINLDQLQKQLNDARIYAQISGLVSDAKGNPGEQVQPYQHLITIQDPSSLVIKADVDDVLALRVAVGQRVQVQFTEFGDGLLDARLVAVPTIGDSDSRRARQVQIALDQPQSGGKLGAIGRAFLILQEKQNVLVVPNATVRAYAGRKYVVVVDGDSRREVDVVTGIVGETETEIIRGLAEGQKVMGR